MATAMAAAPARARGSAAVACFGVNLTGLDRRLSTDKRDATVWPLTATFRFRQNWK